MLKKLHNGNVGFKSYLIFLGLPLFAEKVPNGNDGFKSYLMFLGFCVYSNTSENESKTFFAISLNQVSLICVIAKWGSLWMCLGLGFMYFFFPKPHLARLYIFIHMLIWFSIINCSVSVFGVSAESMQCSYDSKGNSVPTILLLMQERLYSQGGLKVGTNIMICFVIWAIDYALARLGHWLSFLLSLLNEFSGWRYISH